MTEGVWPQDCSMCQYGGCPIEAASNMGSEWEDNVFLLFHNIGHHPCQIPENPEHLENANENIVKKEIGKMTAKMYMMSYYISLHGFINYAEQWCMVDLTDPFYRLALCNAHHIYLSTDYFGTR